MKPKQKRIFKNSIVKITKKWNKKGISKTIIAYLTPKKKKRK